MAATHLVRNLVRFETSADRRGTAIRRATIHRGEEEKKGCAWWGQAHLDVIRSMAMSF
jgi:hypothetical protein